jgi:hypothetical protein
MRRAVWIGLATLSVGCNAVLGNQPGDLADGAAPPSDAAPAAVLDATVLTDSAPVATTPQDATMPGPIDDAAVPPSVDADAIPVCTFGQKLCSGSCVLIDDPLFGCAETSCSPCSLAHATATCDGDGCAVASCDPGYANCDQNAANGCETDLSQPSHCGTCNATCASAAPDCAPMGSGFACTTGCSGGAPTLCSEQCVNLQTSLDDCGACNNACSTVANGRTTCTAGTCGFTCQADFHACGSGCATDVSPATCGTSCAPCPTGANAIATCNGVACGMECEPSYANCDGVASDGCEVNLLTDPANCGRCGVSCDGRACNAGTCAPPIDAGTPPVDAGGPALDAGSARDGGSPDSAAPESDAETSD